MDKEEVLSITVYNNRGIEVSTSCEDMAEFVANLSYGIAGSLKVAADNIGEGADTFNAMKSILMKLLENDITYEEVVLSETGI